MLMGYNTGQHSSISSNFSTGISKQLDSSLEWEWSITSISTDTKLVSIKMVKQAQDRKPH